LSLFVTPARARNTHTHTHTHTHTKCFYFISVVGNTNLKEWSPHSLRCAGICEDHFDKGSFTSNLRKRIKRDAVPIHFESECNGDNYAQTKKSRQMEINKVAQKIAI